MEQSCNYIDMEQSCNYIACCPLFAVAVSYMMEEGYRLNPLFVAGDRLRVVNRVNRIHMSYMGLS